MNSLNQDNVVQIFDTTLRDGEQSPGASMTVEQKVVIARQLEKLGVDVIEAGFAASSDGDFESVRRVAKEVSRPRVVSLARAQEGDISRALKAVEAAKPASITSTPSFSNWRAMTTFCSTVMLAPGDCSPSRKVVSKICTTLS